MNDTAATADSGPRPNPRCGLLLGAQARDWRLAHPERANLRLGLALGALVLAVVFTFICVFTNSGLPKDPGVWRTMHMEQSGSKATLPKDAVGVAPVIPSLPPSPATPVEVQEPKQ